MIWQVIDSSGVGGAERHVATLSCSLKDAGYPVTAVLYGAPGDNPWLRQLEAARLNVRVLDNTVRGLMRAMAGDRPKLVHTHGYKAGILGRMAARLYGVPVVSTFHSGGRGAFPLLAYEIADEWTSWLGQRISVSNDIEKRLPFSSVVVPSFILAGARPAPSGLPRRIGFVGRLSEEKRPDLFCEIATLVDADVEWHAYGDGPMRSELEAKYSGKVRFHGVKTDMEPVWASLGLLLMPSRFEGLPLAALEALAHGVPVVASRVGGLPEVVVEDRTGWMFASGDGADAVERIARWVRLGETQQMSMRQTCWEHVADRFSERRHLPRILDVYRRAGLAMQSTA